MCRFRIFAIILVLSAPIVALKAQGEPPKDTNDFKNVCTNGKTASKLTLKDYMTEFASGPCSPMVLLPGIMGSVLTVQIDCPTLKANDPVTFGHCGWSTCPGDIGHSLESSPRSEYQLWVSGVGSPMTLITPTEYSKLCFGGLIQLVFDKSSGKPIPTDKPGVKIRAKGFSPETRGFKASQCGTTAVKDLIDGIIDPEMTQYYRVMIARFEEMGYLSGLTMQAMPYDFRLHSGSDQVSKNLGRVVKRLKQFNNKKVVIVTHSMGSTKALYGLWNMNQADKDDSVALFIPIAPPFIGAGKPIDYLTCGSREFFILDFGLDMKTFKLSAGSFSSILELAPSLIYSKEASSPWMKKVKDRIAYENKQSNDPVFDWLPKREEICYPNYNQKLCRSGLQNFDYFGTYLKNTRLTIDSYRGWINAHTFNSEAQNIWSILDNRFDSMPNPGVPTVVLFSQALDTEGMFDFSIDPKTASDANRYCNQKEDTFAPFQGDSTVPSTSAVTPAIKWALEFQSKAANSKPVKIVDVCSQFNVKSSPYDSITTDGKKSIDKVEYQGMPCDCSQGKVRHCSHESLLFLPQLIDYVSNTLMTNDRSSVSTEVAGMSEQQLASFQQTCQIAMLLESQSDLADHNIAYLNMSEVATD